MAAISHINWIGVLALLGFLLCCIAGFICAARYSYYTLFNWFNPKGLVPGMLASACIIIGFLFAVAGEYWGGWDLDALFHSLSSVKECPAADKNCNPYDTPENRAIFNKKQVAPAPAAKE